MLPRPRPPALSLPRPITLPPAPICHCRLAQQSQHSIHGRRPPPHHRALFHTSLPYRADNPPPNHYEILHLTQSASSADIKRQFYSLSKKHHPDRNPDDPTASTRFVAISEAYHTLSVPEKRAQYDAQLYDSHGRGSRWGAASTSGPHYPQGSYSSASYAGSRPASGLNKKRGTFRGPPPSFYKSGGYGKHGAKRAEYAHYNPHPHANAASDGAQDTSNAGQDSYGEPGGFGPGQTRHGFEVPHFDDRRHKETHDHLQAHILARRRRNRARDIPDDFDKGGMLFNFLLVSGAVGCIGLSTMFFTQRSERKSKK